MNCLLLREESEKFKNRTKPEIKISFFSFCFSFFLNQAEIKTNLAISILNHQQSTPTPTHTETISKNCIFQLTNQPTITSSTSPLLFFFQYPPKRKDIAQNHEIPPIFKTNLEFHPLIKITKEKKN